MSEHKYADIFRAMADNKVIEGRRPGGTWVVMEEPWKHIGSIEWELRIRPTMITINDVEVVEPVRNPLKHGDDYWLVCIDRIEGTAVSHRWVDDELDNFYLERGLIQLTKEDAQTQAKAMLMSCVMTKPKGCK